VAQRGRLSRSGGANWDTGISTWSSEHLVCADRVDSLTYYILDADLYFYSGAHASWTKQSTLSFAGGYSAPTIKSVPGNTGHVFAANGPFAADGFAVYY
jgi:hypothetical protein